MQLSKQMITEIERSIEECEKQIYIVGSYDLYSRLLAKFTVIDPNFEKGLPRIGKVSSINQEPDYRPEIKAIAEKLKIMLLNAGFVSVSKSKVLHRSIEELIRQGQEIFNTEYIDSDGFMPSYIEGSSYDKWILEIEVICERSLRKHPLYNRIVECNRKKGVVESVRTIIQCLEVINGDEEFFSTYVEPKEEPNMDSSEVKQTNQRSTDKKKVFIVHGHDETMKLSVARTLEKAKLVPIILHEQPNEGLTIIQKFEKHADVAFAIVLYSPCDLGRSKTEKFEDEKPRARQNVIFEHGYLYGRLGRDKVCALLKGDVEKPSDIDGVLYIPMDDRGAWKLEVAREMKNAGLCFDLEALL